jgi:3alpha(or 20beta)-hydroxysteroid dehydrogenase
MGKLDGRVCLITGAARGQGAAEAALFAEEGGIVWLADVLDAPGETTAERVGGTYRHLDVSDEAGWALLVGEILERHGRIDVLVNNAGIFRSNRLLDTPVDEFDQVMNINCKGVFLGMRAVAGPMREAGSGSIVNISSLAGLLGAAGAFAYGTSKWAVRGMTKTAAVELARRGVRVNSIHPGLIETDMAAQLPGNRERMERNIPLGRAASADEVARLALYLASDDSSYSTGSEFIVDGGLHAL